MNKGVSISLQTMVIAALSILVLVVLIIVFTNQVNIFSSTTTACQDRGYECRDECLDDESFYQGGEDACGEGQICCAPEDEVIG